jgi:D-arabinose 1-dehydrogenase-like Zn-dependent alcohol dehydrogenase
MLAQAVESGIQTQIELFPMTQVNEALRRVRNNEARYRVVLAN